MSKYHSLERLTSVFTHDPPNVKNFCLGRIPPGVTIREISALAGCYPEGHSPGMANAVQLSLSGGRFNPCNFRLEFKYCHENK
jgi:hypothetical protein